MIKPLAFVYTWIVILKKNIYRNITEKTVDEKETVFEIGYLIGEEEYLGKGIGKIIVKKLIGEIAEIGGKEILADPDEANVLSIRTLLSNGFVKVKDCDYRYCLK